MKSIEWILTYIRSTKGTHVYGDDANHTVYIQKGEIGSPYPTSVKVTIEWKA
jgi:hypothetical protein